jgi:hypothetical protein
MEACSWEVSSSLCLSLCVFPSVSPSLLPCPSYSLSLSLAFSRSLTRSLCALDTASTPSPSLLMLLHQVSNTILCVCVYIYLLCT